MYVRNATVLHLGQKCRQKSVLLFRKHFVGRYIDENNILLSYLVKNNNVI